MRKLILITLLLQVLAAMVAAAPTEASQINKAKRTIQRAERYLTSIEKRMQTEKQPVPTIIAGWEKKADKAAGFLSQAEQILSSIDSAKAEKAYLTSTRERLKSIRSAVVGSSNRVKEATTLAKGSGGQQAVQDYKQLADTFLSVTQWLRNNDDNPKMMEAYQNALQAKAALDQKYASVIGMRSQETFPITSAANQAKMTEQGVLNDINRAKSTFPQIIDQLLQQARESSQTLIQNKAFGGWETAVQLPLDQAALMARKLNAVAPGAPAALSVSRKVDGALAEFDAKKSNLRAQMIASNKLPPDAYRGSEAGALKAAIRKAWAQKHPQDRILQVSIADSQWSNFSGTEWSNSSRSWRRYDFDRMKGHVLVAGPGQYNYRFLALVVRQNLQGGKIDILPTRPTNPEEHVSTLVAK